MSPQPAAAHAARPANAARATAPRAAKQWEDTHTDLMRLDLRDVPYIPQGLNVDALKPSLLSRFVGMFIK